MIYLYMFIYACILYVGHWFLIDVFGTTLSLFIVTEGLFFSRIFK